MSHTQQHKPGTPRTASIAIAADNALGTFDSVVRQIDDMRDQIGRLERDLAATRRELDEQITAAAYLRREKAELEHRLECGPPRRDLSTARG